MITWSIDKIYGFNIAVPICRSPSGWAYVEYERTYQLIFDDIDRRSTNISGCCGGSWKMRLRQICVLGLFNIVWRKCIRRTSAHNMKSINCVCVDYEAEIKLIERNRRAREGKHSIKSMQTYWKWQRWHLLNFDFKFTCSQSVLKHSSSLSTRHTLAPEINRYWNGKPKATHTHKHIHAAT